MKNFLKCVGKFLLFFLAFHFAASLAALVACEVLDNGRLAMFLTVTAVTVGIFVLYLIFRKMIDAFVVWMNMIIAAVTFITFTLLMIISRGNINGNLMAGAMFPAFPYTIFLLYTILTNQNAVGFTAVLAGTVASVVFSNAFGRNCRISRRWLALSAAGLVILSTLNVVLYNKRDEKKYAGHGFKYMHGYSTTDLTDYTVFAKKSKLVSLDHEASLKITDDMPIMDGAEACYPLYAAVAKSVYAGIENIEEAYEKSGGGNTNGVVVTFTNSVQGFNRLLRGEIDLFFGAKPSKSQIQEAEELGIELEITQIGREGFVFFVKNNNPVTSLTEDQIRRIYHGDIINWSEVGGRNEAIKAFQRPAGSGSQTMMEYFMGDVALKSPDTYEVIGGMGDVVDKVAEYADENGAMGYTFRYFLEGLNQEKNVRMLSVNGIAPTRENIGSGEYPLTVGLYLVTRKDTDNPNVEKMIDFMMSEDGQYLVEQTGYARLPG